MPCFHHPLRARRTATSQALDKWINVEAVHAAVTINITRTLPLQRGVVDIVLGRTSDCRDEWIDIEAVDTAIAVGITRRLAGTIVQGKDEIDQNGAVVGSQRAGVRGRRIAQQLRRYGTYWRVVTVENECPAAESLCYPATTGNQVCWLMNTYRADW